MEALAQSHPVEVHWRSYELRPKGAPPISPAYRAQIEANRPRLYATARDQYGLEMNPGPFGIDTRPALVAAKVAEAMGIGPAYHEQMMRAYWQKAQNIEDRILLIELAEQAGADRQAFIDALDDPLYDHQVQADIDQARAYGLNGVPAMVFDNRYLVSGAQPLPVLQRVVEQIQNEKSE